MKLRNYKKTQREKPYFFSGKTPKVLRKNTSMG
jgi:hypothetical protein